MSFYTFTAQLKAIDLFLLVKHLVCKISGYEARSKSDLDINSLYFVEDFNPAEMGTDDTKPPPIPPRRRPQADGGVKKQCQNPKQTLDVIVEMDEVVACDSQWLSNNGQGQPAVCNNDLSNGNAARMKASIGATLQNISGCSPVRENSRGTLYGQRQTNKGNDSPKLAGCNRDSGTWV